MGDFFRYYCRLPIIFLVLSLAVIAIIINPPIWMRTRYDLTFTNDFTSAEGKFSVKIPRSWELNKTPSWRNSYATHDISFGAGEIYLRALGEIYIHIYDRWGDYRTPRLDRYAYMSVSMTSASHAVDAQELGDSLLAALREERTRLETHNNSIPWSQLRGPMINDVSTKLRFEAQKLNGCSWAKTTVTDPSKIYIYWQTVDNRRNRYTITFETNNISYYEPFFDNIMRSFSFN